MLAANKDEFRIILPNSAAANGHKITVSGKAKVGDDVTVTVTPADGYELYLGSLKANGVKVSKKGGAYSFVMPAADVAITASFCKEGTGPAEAKGDANGDGNVNIADVALICRYIMGEAQLSADARELCRHERRRQDKRYGRGACLYEGSRKLTLGILAPYPMKV